MQPIAFSPIFATINGRDENRSVLVSNHSIVGDPFKDTSGPSLNILIKLMSMVSIVMAGQIVACM